MAKSVIINGRIPITQSHKHVMITKLPSTFLFLFASLILLTACAPGTTVPLTSGQASTLAELDEMETAVPPTLPPIATNEPRPTIILPISVYIVDDVSGSLNSNRDAEEIAAIYEQVNDIWAQAGIVIDVSTIQRLTLPDAVVQSIVRGDFRPFFAGIEDEFTIPEPSQLNGFYASDIGGPNGIVPFSADLFFVTDEPSVHDERVTSHEIGHILGLHHTLTDSDRLMFSGTNGMTLTEEEIIVARYVAQGLLDHVR